MVENIVKRNEQGYVETNRQQQTSVEGIYAAGDVCIKPLRQVVTAVGDGALAATELERYAASMQEKTGIHPVNAVKKPKAGKVPQQKVSEEAQTGLFSEEIKNQLFSVFQKMERPLVLKLSLDSRPVSLELKNYVQEMAALTEKLTVEELKKPVKEAPCVQVFLKDGTDTGLAFHGVPGGHEFTSFILGLYNAAGPGQALDEEMIEKIQAVKHPVEMQIMVSLSCTMCPELVTAAQKIAALNPMVKAEVYDLNHFPDMKEKYHVMSVPCMVMNDDKVTFGKKNIPQILELIS